MRASLSAMLLLLLVLGSGWVADIVEAQNPSSGRKLLRVLVCDDTEERRPVGGHFFRPLCYLRRQLIASLIRSTRRHQERLVSHVFDHSTYLVLLMPWHVSLVLEIIYQGPIKVMYVNFRLFHSLL
ncbi:hypothetical protein Droror1_Dr00022992 [Drosera rotundifolia]